MDRRAFLRTSLSLLAAPAIVPIRSLMPLRGIILRPYALTWHQRIAEEPWRPIRKYFWAAETESRSVALRLLNDSLALEYGAFGNVATLGQQFEPLG